MTSIDHKAERQKVSTKSADSKSLSTDTSRFCGPIMPFITITFLLFILLFYHAMLRIESHLLEDRANLYQNVLAKTTSLKSDLSIPEIQEIKNVISTLKLKDSQLLQVNLFTPDGKIIYSSTLGLIGDHISSTWEEILANNTRATKILEPQTLSLLYTISSPDKLILSFSFKNEPFWTLYNQSNGFILLIVAILPIICFSLFIKSQNYKFNHTQTLTELNKQRIEVSNELDQLSKDLKNYENL